MTIKQRLDHFEKLSGHRYLPTSPRHEAWLVWNAAWQAAQARPEGFVLVPRVPTEEMIMNGLLVISTEVGKYDIQKEVRMIWEKMIEAQEQKG